MLFSKSWLVVDYKKPPKVCEPKQIEYNSSSRRNENPYNIRFQWQWWKNMPQLSSNDRIFKPCLVLFRNHQVYRLLYCRTYVAWVRVRRPLVPGCRVYLLLSRRVSLYSFCIRAPIFLGEVQSIKHQHSTHGKSICPNFWVLLPISNRTLNVLKTYSLNTCKMNIHSIRCSKCDMHFHDHHVRPFSQRCVYRHPFDHQQWRQLHH